MIWVHLHIRCVRKVFLSKFHCLTSLLFGKRRVKISRVTVLRQILQRRAYLTILSFYLEVLISVHFFFAFKDVLIADAFRYFLSCLAFQKDALELMTSDSFSAVFPELGPSYFYFLLQCYLNL